MLVKRQSSTPPRDLRADRDAVGGDASDVVDIDSARRALADVDVRYRPVDLDPALHRDAVVPWALVEAILEAAVLASQWVEAVCVAMVVGMLRLPWVGALCDVQAAKGNAPREDWHQCPRRGVAHREVAHCDVGALDEREHVAPVAEVVVEVLPGAAD